MGKSKKFTASLNLGSQKIRPMKHFLMPSLFLFIFALPAWTNKNGAPQGKSGSPQSNGETCTACHYSGSVSSQTISVTSDIPSDGYVDNTNYTITVKMQGNGGNHSVMGFMASIEDGSGHQGSLTAGSNNQIKSSNYVTQTNSGSAASGDSASWSFTWNSGTAPDSTKIYIAGNFANNDGGTGGDIIDTHVETLMRSHVGLDEVSALDLRVIAQRTLGTLWIDAAQARAFGSLHITDLMGRQVYQSDWKPSDTQGRELWLPSLSAGQYVLTLQLNQGQTVSERFIW